MTNVAIFMMITGNTSHLGWRTLDHQVDFGDV